MPSSSGSGSSFPSGKAGNATDRGKKTRHQAAVQPMMAARTQAPASRSGAKIVPLSVPKR